MSVEVFLQHTFGDFALNAEFAIEKSGITALYGPSGAGKTTIINAIAGLLKPQSGRVVVNGRSLLDTRSGTFVPAHMRGIGYVFQDARLFPHMNVENNLRFGWRRAAVRASESEIAGVISLLGLENLLARGVAKLSGGEKSRVALGRALLCTPGLLLLDEPLAALDGARKAEIFPYLERLRDEAKLPMLYVSHSLDEVTRLAGNVIFLNDGRIMAHGPVGEMVGQTGFGAVLDARVSPRDAGEGLSMLSFDGGELIVSRLMQPAGKRLRVRIRAEDVMLALEEPRGISANNVLPVVVRNLRFGDAGHADVALACGSSLLLARITRASATRLNLKPGLALFAIVKSVTVDPQIS